MPLYRPPLLLKDQRDINTLPQIEDALKGLTTDYFYTGKREGNSDNIELDVSTVIVDADENIFIRSCNYSGQKHTWKKVIKDQLKTHLKDIGVEEGFANSEIRYFVVSKEKFLSQENYDKKFLFLKAKVNRIKEQ